MVRGVSDPMGGARDIAVSDETIVAAAPDGVVEIDGEGLMALPRLADAHVHLDKTLLGERWFPHRPAATLRERAAMERDLLESDLVAPFEVRAARLLHAVVARGTTLLQSHIDVEDSTGIRRVETMLRLAEDHADVIDVTLVAFPQAGLGSRARVQALDEALGLGAEAVGGLDPMTLDGDRDAHLDGVFELAERHGARVDVHVHEPDRVGTTTIRAIAERARALSLQGRCAVSHGYALAQVDDVELGHTAAAMADAGVSVITSVPGDGRLPPLDRLRELGVNAVVASDNIRDSWSPFGDGDQLARAGLAAYCSNWREDRQLAEALPLVSANPAAALGRPEALLRTGDRGDFTLVRARNLSEALIRAPAERTVIRGGRVVACEGKVIDTNWRTELSEA